MQQKHVGNGHHNTMRHEYKSEATPTGDTHDPPSYRVTLMRMIPRMIPTQEPHTQYDVET